MVLDGAGVRCPQLAPARVFHPQTEGSTGTSRPNICDQADCSLILDAGDNRIEPRQVALHGDLDARLDHLAMDAELVELASLLPSSDVADDVSR